GGAFDITVAPLMRCWGFMRGRGRLPHPAELAEARERVGVARARLEGAGCTVRVAREGVSRDLGSFGEGGGRGRPARLLREGGAVLAAVALPSATESDALSTALLILGSAGHERVAGLRAGMRTLVVSRGEQDGQFSVKAKGIQLLEPTAAPG